MSIVTQMAQMASAIETAFIVGMLEAAKRLEIDIYDVVRIDEIGRIDMKFIDEFHGDDEDRGGVS